MKVWIHQSAKHRWYKYFWPKWLNSVTWKKGEVKIFRWIFWGYSFNK